MIVVFDTKLGIHTHNETTKIIKKCVIELNLIIMKL